MQFKCFCYSTTKWWSLATWSSWNDFILPQSEKTFFWSFLFPLSDLFVAVKQFFIIISLDQHAKKVVSDSPGLVDFAIGQVKIVLKWNFLRNANYRRNVKSIVLIKTFLGLVQMTFVVNATFSLPEWQAVKLTFFAPCSRLSCCE